jgi:hypothetical protein
VTGNTRLYVVLLGCAALVLGALVLIRYNSLDDELLGGGLIALGLAAIIGALPAG